MNKHASWVARVAASAAIRKIVYIVIAAIIGLAGTLLSGNARAQTWTPPTYCDGSTAGRCDQGKAYKECMSRKGTYDPINYPGRVLTRTDCLAVAETGPHVIGSFRQRYWYRDGTGSEQGPFNADLHKYASTCATRPVVYGGMIAKGPVCSNGCMYDLAPSAEQHRIDQPQSDSIFFGKGGYGPTGATCSTPPSPPKPPPSDDYCATLEGGHKLCHNKDGKKCVISGKTGRKYCWNPGQQGPAVNPERTEGFSKGEDVPAPAPTPRTGENWQQGDGSTTTNTTTGGTTNVSNFNNSGTKGSTPTPGDGSDNEGEGGDGEGEDDGEEGSVEGGATCEAAPTCSGDPILCAINENSWRARCDHGEPLVDEEGIPGDEAPPDDAIIDSEEDGDLDTSGFGWARACPTATEFEVFGNTYNFDTNGVLCGWLQIGGALMLLFASLASVRILAGAAN